MPIIAGRGARPALPAPRQFLPGGGDRGRRGLPPGNGPGVGVL